MDDVGNNQSTVAITGLVSGFVAIVLCVFALSIRSCNVAAAAADSAKKAKISADSANVAVARYQAMAVCAKTAPALECEHLFK